MLVSYVAIHCALTQHPSEEKGGGGGYSLEFYMVRLWPFPTPSWELCIPLNCCERHCVKMWISLKTSTFSQFFHSHASVSPFDPLYRLEWLISLPFYILRQVKSLPFHIHEAWKRYPFWARPPRIGHYRNTPTPCLEFSPQLFLFQSFTCHVKFVVWKQVRLSAVLSHNFSRSHLYNTACLTLSCKSFKAG